MSPRKNLWFGVASVIALVLLGTLIHPSAEARARAAATTSATTTQPRDTTACYHDDASVWHNCDEFLESTAIRSVTVTVNYANGSSRTRVAGARADAIFLTKDAATRFLSPYYRAKRDRENLEKLEMAIRTGKVRP